MREHAIRLISKFAVWLFYRFDVTTTPGKPEPGKQMQLVVSIRPRFGFDPIQALKNRTG